MKKISKCFILLTIITGSLFTAVSYAQNEALCNKFLRVHILANSNSSFDQGVKMAVRDYLFKNHENEFSQFKTKEDAMHYINNNKELLENEINEYLNYLSCDYISKIEIKKESFIKKNYENIALPKGNYDAIKITLGSGNGKNFFCVMFPPMCVSDSVVTSVKLNDILTDKESKILSGKIEYKFKILELLKGDVKKLQNTKSEFYQ